jgi:SAM-dependent methyltransferase
VLEKGWFDIPGVQKGDRTLAEQMKGLEPALAACSGKRLLDLGCAEGLIAFEFAAAGAHVLGVDMNTTMIDLARRMAKQRFEPKSRPRFENATVQALMVEASTPGNESWFEPGYDIVLALAVVHKLEHPAQAVRFVATIARERAVIRLPVMKTRRGEPHVIHGKHSGITCDVNAEMMAHGFRLAEQLPGPRGEFVQHWLR